jgi:SPP1 family predicted phage head-tail adaptor
MTPAGKRDKRVIIEQKSVTRNSIGEESVTWVTFATRWAAVSPIRGREFFAAEQTMSSVDYRVNLLKPLAVTREMRIKHGAILMDIVSIIDNDNELELMCSTGVRNAI